MKNIHKYDRLKGEQYIRCTGKKCTMSESVTYFWDRVSCAKCFKLQYTRIKSLGDRKLAIAIIACLLLGGCASTSLHIAKNCKKVSELEETYVCEQP